ncbi:SurA N-terminal domain-containing protein, partial [Candidatus Saccharibacteria bacterium]|nr:SurA N-terminal domain-containing protein [Candidatus Saccharibacteria bacterium]
FAKHRLVFITIALATVALVVAGVLGWASLYKFQNTSDILYRLTTVIPVPVAKVDGEPVRYSDYLMIYRSSITPVEQQNGTFSNVKSDEESFSEYYKRAALTEAENYTYALKLARQLDINVNDEQVDQAFEEHRKLGGTDRSKESFLKVLEDNFSLTEREYRRILYLSLIRVEVSKKIDAEATRLANEAYAKVKNGEDFKAVAEGMNLEYNSTNELIDVKNVDGGRSDRAYEMNPGDISEVFVSDNGDCYYILKLIEKSDGKVNYVSITVPFTEFEKRLDNVREENRVDEYIELKDDFDSGV